MRLSILVLGLILPLLSPALAQTAFAPPKAPGKTVTILSDALSEPGGEASLILRDLSILLDREGELRALIIDDYGGPPNINDLLQLRGTDFAVVNNDALTYLALAKALPPAAGKVKLVAPLVNQGVFFLARSGIEKVDGLKGRKVAVPASRPSRGVTARTILGLLKIDAPVTDLDDKDLEKGLAGDAGAVLIFEQDLPRLKAWGISPAAYHILAIPVSGPLAQAYLPGKLGKTPIEGFSSTGSETVQVTTLLAAFDWSSTHSRYPAASDFTAKFFALLPELRARNPKSALRRADVRAAVPGWQRLDAAAPLASAAAAPSAAEDSLRATADTAAAAPGLKLLAVARPPLTNPQQGDGGVVLKLLTDALAAAGVPVTVQWTADEKALLAGLTGANAADAGVFWQTPGCEAPAGQSSSEADVCDRAALSEPLMQAVFAVFTRLDTPLDPGGPEATQSRTLCIPESQPVPIAALAAVPWLKAANVKTLRPKTLIDCLAAADRRDADALIVIEPEARYAIERLKLTQSLQIAQRLPVATGLHAIVAKDHPRQAEILQTIGSAIAKLKTSGGYATVMTSHLADLTGAPMAQP